jgi:tetratricopeptide (TPR) repeat protein
MYPLRLKKLSFEQTMTENPVGKQREKWYRLAMVLVPLLFFVAAELVLRWVNYGGDLRLFNETLVNGAPFYIINPDVTRRYFRTIQVRAGMASDVFAKEKAPTTFRIFCLGESSTLGYPYFYNGAFPSMIKDRLETLWPEKNFEVVNLGVTAVNSYTVADFSQELTAYKPDAILVYCGHNEFYGALGVGSTESLGRNRGLVKAYLAMEEWRLFRLLRDGVNGIKELISSSSNRGREATVMEGMVRSQEIEYGSDAYRAAVSNFQANMEEIAQIGARNNVPVVFGTLVSNLGGLEPFVSSYNANTQETQKKALGESYANAMQAFEHGRYDEARSVLDSAIRIDSMPARLHFILGRVEEQAGHTEATVRQFKLARDLDALRFRAPSEFNSILHSVALRTRAHVAEVEQLIEAKSKYGIIGNQFLLEHVHMNVDGYSLTAKAFVQAMAEDDIVAPRQQWRWDRDKSDARYRAEVGVTPLDSVMAAIRLWVLMQSWPFTNTGVSVHEYHPQTAMEEIAKACLVKELTWEKAHVQMADVYTKEGKPEQAAQEYFALAKATPYNVSPLLRLGRLLLSAGKWAEAQAAFDRSLKIGPTLYAYQGLGLALLQKDRFEEASGQFWKSLQYSNGVPINDVLETQQYLAVALAASGKVLEAQRIAESMVSTHPEYLPGKDLLRNIEQSLQHSKRKLP